MARERMVTRSVAVGNYDVMTVNTVTKEVSNIVIPVPSYNALTDKQLVAVIGSSMPEHTLAVKWDLSEVTETLYGMPEAEFIRLARVLPPRAKTE